MANLLGLQPLVQRQDDYYSKITTPGIRPETPSSPFLAGSFGGIDLDEAKKVKEALGEEALFGYMINQARRQESDPQRLREQLEVLGPYLKDVAREKQRLGMESNIFAGLMNLPNKWQEAMAEKFRFTPYSLNLAEKSVASNPFVTRQYINI